MGSANSNLKIYQRRELYTYCKSLSGCFVSELLHSMLHGVYSYLRITTQVLPSSMSATACNVVSHTSSCQQLPLGLASAAKPTICCLHVYVAIGTAA